MQTALITGGAKRVGRAIVEDLAKAGWTLAIHYNSSADEAEALAADICDNGGKAAAVGGDLSNDSDFENIIESANAKIGTLTVLLNNASLFERDTLETMSPKLWHDHFSVNVMAPSFLAQAFAAQLPGDQTGNVINIIDQRVWRLNPNFFSYTLSKSALWAATQTMAQSLAPRIRVNAIGPGPTLASSRQDEADFNKQVAAIPLQKGPDLSEFAKTIHFLVETSSITGQMVALDGGQHLAWQTPDAINNE